MKILTLDKKILFAICLIFHLLAVIFGEGFHRPDEYLGIIRMMQFKLSTFPIEELSWEYPAQIRPWPQPAIYYCLHILCKFLTIENPFIIATVFRLFSSALGFYSIILLTNWAEPLFTHKKYHHLAIAGLCLLWFLPFFHARTNSENFGITFFIFALCLLRNHALWAGCMLGFSFIFRFQMGIMVASLILFIFIFEEKRKIIPIITGILFANFLGLIIDRWGYGEWTFTPWNYFYHNILLDKASDFGTSSWYYYLQKALSRGILPVSLFFTLPFLWLWIKRPTHILSFLSLPYFIIHSIIPHKEIRFIFSLGLFAPLVLAMFVENIQKKILFEKSSWWKILLILTLIVNNTALIIASTKPAYAPMGFYRHLYYKKEIIKKINILFFQRDILDFYLKTPVKIKKKEFKQLQKDVHLKKKITGYYLSNQLEHKDFFIKLENCQLEYNPYPDWIIDILFKWKIKAKIWSLYYCR